MKLAVTGKGGSGKTVLVALCARAMAELGWRVLALDIDPNPGLGLSLGTAVSGRSPIEGILEQQDGAPYGAGLGDDVSPRDLVRRYGSPVDDRVVVVSPSKFERLGENIGPSITAVRQLAEGFEEPGWVTVADLDAGPTSLFEASPTYADLALVVVEATPASMLAASRLVALLAYEDVASALVVNKSVGPGDTERVEAQLGEVLAAVPFDPDVRRLDRAGSLTRLSATSPALAAARELIERIGVGVPATVGST